MSMVIVILLQLLLAFNIEAKIFAWGVNDYGQLGLNGSVFRVPQSIPAYENLNIVNLKASGTYHVAVTDSGSVYVGGNNWYGALGLGSNQLVVTVPVKNNFLTNCQIFVGRRHGNAICGSKFYGWGLQAGYVKGYTTGIYPSVTQSLPQYGIDGKVQSVMAGGFLSYVTLTNGTVLVAGAGNGGVLGLGDTVNRPYFAQFDFFEKNSIPVQNISRSHASHVCAITKTYSLYCWGDNSYGQLGIGNRINQTQPTLVSFFESKYYVVQVTTGATHTLALTASGKVFAWGLAQNGALGNGRSDNVSFTTPVEITALADKNIIEIVSGLNFNFARTSGNSWYSWGAGSGGVLGTYQDQDVYQPTLVSFLDAFNINQILTASTSRSVYGWLDPSAPTAINGPPQTNWCQGYTCPIANSQCQNNERNKECVCISGYTFNADKSSCVDIDECAASACVVGATCTNSPGSFSCTCPSSAPVGDGKVAGTGCKATPVLSTTGSTGTTGSKASSTSSTTKSSSTASASTSSPTTSPVATSQAGTTSSKAGTSGSTTGAATSGSATSGSATSGSATSGSSSASSSSSSSSSSSPSTSGGGNANSGSGSTATSGNGNSGSSTTATSTKASTTRTTNYYHTLAGYEEPELDTSSTTSDSAIVDPATNNPKSNSNNNKERDVMIGVLVAFGLLILIVVGAGIYLLYFRNHRS